MFARVTLTSLALASLLMIPATGHCQTPDAFIGAGFDVALSHELDQSSFKISGFKSIHPNWSLGASVNVGLGSSKGRLEKALNQAGTEHLKDVAKKTENRCDVCSVSVGDYDVRGYQFNMGLHPLPWLRLSAGLGEQEYRHIKIDVEGSTVVLMDPSKPSLLSSEQESHILASTATYGASLVGHLYGLDWELSLTFQDTLGTKVSSKGTDLIPAASLDDFVLGNKILFGLSIGYIFEADT